MSPISTSSIFIQSAPMEGVVDAIVRALLTELGGLDRVVTEFIRVTDRLLPNHVFVRYCPELLNGGVTPSNTPCFVQLLGGQPQPMAENAARAAELGAPGVDLNFGCPAKTVNRHDGGAALLQWPERVFAIVSAVRLSVPTPLPVTAKVRLGFTDKHLCQDIAQAVEAGGATSLVVHARTKLEGYQPPAHWEYVSRMASAVRMPVIVNGDIWSVEDYYRCRSMTGIPHVALGRGLFANPGLAGEIRSSLVDHDSDRLKALPVTVPGGLGSVPSLTWSRLQGQLLPRFVQMCQSLRGEQFALCRLKQWVKFLTRNFPEAGQAFDRLKLAKNLSDVHKLNLFSLNVEKPRGETPWLPQPQMRPE